MVFLILNAHSKVGILFGFEDTGMTVWMRPRGAAMLENSERGLQLGIPIDRVPTSKSCVFLHTNGFLFSNI